MKKYERTQIKKTFCPRCMGEVELLAAGLSEARWNDPAFYICWPCRWIGQVGVGEVKEAEDADSSDVRK